MEPAELAAGVAAADGQLAPDRPRRRPGPRSTPRSRRGSAPGCASRSAEPVAHRRRRGRPCPHPTFRHSRRRLAEVDLDEVEQAVEVEVGDGGAAAAGEARAIAGRLGGLDERPVGLAEQEVARVLRRVVGLASTLPFETNRSMNPSLLTSCELRVPGGRGQGIAAGERLGGGDAAPERDVAVRRLARAGGQRLELVVALAREVDLGVAVAGDVLAGDAHAPDLRSGPSRRRRCRAAAARPGSIRQSCSSPSR